VTTQPYSNPAGHLPTIVHLQNSIAQRKQIFKKKQWKDTDDIQNDRVNGTHQGNMGPHVSTCLRASTSTCALLSPNFVPMTDSRPSSQSRWRWGMVSAFAAT
jgi:hypothetical protein